MSSVTLHSANPALTNENAFNPFAYGDGRVAPSNVCTMSGVIGKTALLVTIAMIAGAGGYWWFLRNPGTLWIASIAAFIVSMGIFFVMYGKPQLSKVFAPVYAVTQGAFLGGFTAIAEQILANSGRAVPGGLAFQALVATFGVFAAILILYQTGMVRPSRRLAAIIGVATLGIAITYLLSFVLSFFGIQMPFINLGSTLDTGRAGFIGLGLNVLILGVAAFSLVMDFGRIEANVQAGAPKYMEWYSGFALLVTLAWIYFEAVKLIMRLAVLFGRRD
ncbi:MAG: Bax inhibitor-1/YccA family protein [Phycisphaerales bacterium]